MTTADVLKTLDNTMAMKSGEWLEEQLDLGESPVIFDLRGRELWDKGHISGSVQISINNLPENASRLIPSKDSIVICICNGSVQSAMATVYLRSEDYRNTYNLSGGYSAWIRNERAVEVTK